MQWYWLVLLICGGLLALTALAGYFGFRYCLVDTAGAPPSEAMLARSAYRKYLPALREGRKWLEAQPSERWELRSFDGLKLVGHYLPNPEGRGVLLLAHGFRSCYLTDFSCCAEFYTSLGLSLLLIEQRGQQASEGRYMTYGIKESRDIVSWAQEVRRRCGAQQPLFLGGVSMGAASVQMACGRTLPDNVVGMIADCGFTGAYEEIKYVLQKRLHLPAFPLLPTVELYCRLFAGFSLKEYSTVTAQSGSTLPALFIHGKKDLFVPCYMTEESYRACRSEDKELLLVDEATHGVSYLEETARYEQAVRRFIDRQLSRRKG